MTVLLFLHATPLSLHPSPTIQRTLRPLAKHNRLPCILCTPSPSNHHYNPSHNDNGTTPNSHETTPPPAPPSSDRKAFEELTSNGVSSLNALGEQAKQELQFVSDSTSAFADSLISDEMEALLKRYDERQRELLDDIDHQRQVIQEEMQRISKLANEGKSSVAQAVGRTSGQVSRRMLYSVNCFLFGVAGFSVMVGGIAKGDSSDIAYAGLLIGVAFVWAVLLRREERNDRLQRESGDEKG